MSTNKYAASHKSPNGPGDARPTALQIVQDEGLEGKLSNKVVLITGCSSGIGVETARALAATGATLFLTARDLDKGTEALSGILSPGRIELLRCDLSSLASVRSCAEEFLSKSNGKLNLLINNAGVMAVQTLTKTVDGFEMQFGTNHLGHFLLFQLVKPALLASSTPSFPSRVVNLSSSGHRASGIHFDDINLEAPGSYHPWVAYGQAKTANIYMANSIERHYGSRGLHGLSVHPGGILTPLQRHLDDATTKFFNENEVVGKGMKSTEQGAATTVLAAIGKEFEGVGGKYLEDSGEWGPVPNGEYGLMDHGHEKHAFDEEKEEKLWTESLKMVGLPADDE